MLYHDVITELSKNARMSLNQKLPTDAEKNYNKGNNELAARSYRQLFADYL